VHNGILRQRRFQKLFSQTFRPNSRGSKYSTERRINTGDDPGTGIKNLLVEFIITSNLKPMPPASRIPIKNSATVFPASSAPFLKFRR